MAELGLKPGQLGPGGHMHNPCPAQVCFMVETRITVQEGMEGTKEVGTRGGRLSLR